MADSVLATGKQSTDLPAQRRIAPALGTAALRHDLPEPVPPHTAINPMQGPDPVALGRFLKRKRQKTPRALLPEVGGSSRRPSTKWASRAQVSAVVRMTEGWLAQIETGKASMHVDYLDPMAEALLMSPAERTVLWKLAVGWDPPSTERRLLTVGRGTQAILNKLAPWPAYVSDFAWNIVACNEAVTEAFPPLKLRANVMVEALKSPVMRELLYDWERSWAWPMLGQLLGAQQLCTQPEQRAELDAVVDSVLQDEDVARVWNNDPDVYIHPDGELRPVILYGRLQMVMLSATEVPGFPLCRKMVLIPEEELTPQDEPTVWQYTAAL